MQHYQLESPRCASGPQDSWSRAPAALPPRRPRCWPPAPHALIACGCFSSHIHVRWRRLRPSTAGVRLISPARRPPDSFASLRKAGFPPYVKYLTQLGSLCPLTPLWTLRPFSRLRCCELRSCEPLFVPSGCVPCRGPAGPHDGSVSDTDVRGGGTGLHGRPPPGREGSLSSASSRHSWPPVVFVTAVLPGRGIFILLRPESFRLTPEPSEQLPKRLY